MQSKTRLIAVVYVALYLTWVVLLGRLLREPHFPIPDGVVVRWVATPFACLLISHRFVCRGWFGAAAVPLIYWVLLLSTGYVSVPICGNR
jgi:hypothetical protein